MKLDPRIPSGPIEEKWTKRKNSVSLVSPGNKKKYRVIVVGTGLANSGTALEYGNDFVAMETPRLPGAPALRDVSDSEGDWSVFLPPNQSYHYASFDPASGLIAHGFGVTAPSGQRTHIGTPVFLASAAPGETLSALQ